MRKLQLSSLAGLKNNADMVETGMGLTEQWAGTWRHRRAHDCAELCSHHVPSEPKDGWATKRTWESLIANRDIGLKSLQPNGALSSMQTQCGGLDQFGPHRLMCLNMCPTENGTVRRCGLVWVAMAFLEEMWCVTVGMGFEVSYA